MAARINKPFHAEKTKGLIKASQLLNELIKYVEGKRPMTAAQVNAAKIVIGKYIPDLQAITMTSEVSVRNVISDEPLTEEEWVATYGDHLATAAGTAEKLN